MTIFRTTLMPHQRDAVEKLSRLRVGALYMDMGTGKTRASLELAIARLKAGKIDRILWLCPVNVKRTIAEEIEKHCDGISWAMPKPGKPITDAIIQIVGIESLSLSKSLSRLLHEYIKTQRVFIVLDESSLIKNHRAMRTLASWRLGEQCQYRLILNGTPIDNNAQDLWAQWAFLDLRILGYSSYYSFAANHLEFDPNNPKRVLRAHNVQHLVRKLAPYAYQVRKSECLDLPKKLYSRRYCHLTNAQRDLYDATKERILNEAFDHPDDPTIIYRLFTALQLIVSGWDPQEQRAIYMPNGNPRLDVLLNVLDELPADAQVSIWAKYRHELSAIATTLRERYGADQVAEFWGAIPAKRRIHEMQRFKGGARFIVANTHCAAYGLNLQYAPYAIFYSSDFAWAKRTQAEDRQHRIGMNGNVLYTDIVCCSTIDERIMSCLARKEDLSNAFRRQLAAQKNRKETVNWLDQKGDTHEI